MISNKLDSQKSQKLVENNSSSISTPSSLKEEYIFLKNHILREKYLKFYTEMKKYFQKIIIKNQKAKILQTFCINAYIVEMHIVI